MARVDNEESENAGFIVLLGRLNGASMDAHPLLRHDFCPLKRINLYFLLEKCAPQSVDQVIQPTREVSSKGVIEMRRSLIFISRLSRIGGISLID